MLGVKYSKLGVNEITGRWIGGRGYAHYTLSKNETHTCIIKMNINVLNGGRNC